MKIEAITKKAEALYNVINKAIEDDELKTWEILKDKDGNVLYSHSPEQWSGTAMLKPILEEEKLILKLVSWKGKDEPTIATKGYITGRFTEALLVHFNKHFTQLNTFA